MKPLPPPTINRQSSAIRYPAAGHRWPVRGAQATTAAASQQTSIVGSTSRQTAKFNEINTLQRVCRGSIASACKKTAMIRTLFFPIHYLTGCYQHETIFRNDLRIDDSRVFVRLRL
jgi:hypothetical protein